MRMYGRLALHAESVVLPLLAPDAPVVTWWHGEPPDQIAHDPLGVVADRRITDCAAGRRTRSRRCGSGPRTTPPATPTWPGPGPPLWRALCASAFDTVHGARSGGAGQRRRARTRAAALLAGWLSPPARHRGRAGRHRRAPASPGCVLDASSGDDRHDHPRRTAATACAPHRPAGPVVPLPRRDLGDLLAEELRRLDADQLYAEALGRDRRRTVWRERSPHRVHVWHDPVESDDPDPRCRRHDQRQPDGRRPPRRRPARPRRSRPRGC